MIQAKSTQISAVQGPAQPSAAQTSVGSNPVPPPARRDTGAVTRDVAIIRQASVKAVFGSPAFAAVAVVLEPSAVVKKGLEWAAEVEDWILR